MPQSQGRSQEARGRFRNLWLECTCRHCQNYWFCYWSTLLRRFRECLGVFHCGNYNSLFLSVELALYTSVVTLFQTYFFCLMFCTFFFIIIISLSLSSRVSLSLFCLSSEALFHLQDLVLLGLSHWSVSVFVKISWSMNFQNLCHPRWVSQAQSILVEGSDILSNFET